MEHLEDTQSIEVVGAWFYEEVLMPQSVSEMGNNILLIEDESLDALLVKKQFDQHRVTNELIRVKTGEEGIRFLRREAPYADRPEIGVVLLDLNLPGVSGFEVLSEIRNNAETKDLIVLVFTSSDDQNDLLQSVELHTDGYLVKPFDYDQFLSSIQISAEYASTLSFRRRANVTFDDS